jgi:outer membrane protein OmpA-like peptidoglycan-associated protein
MQKTLFRSTSIAALALAPFITGCATKKFVRTTVAPIQQKVGELDNTTKAHAESISELERGVARADERAMGADARAEAAAKEAALARTEAASASKEATEGRQYAETGINKVSGEMTAMNGAINQRFENIRDFKLIANESVLFAINQSELSKESMATLDEAVGKVHGLKNFVLELQGFTDSTGSKAANLELSRKRADAVVRYLNAKHNIPLHRIYVAGFGPDNSIADNKTRAGRKQNRRVDMKVYLSADEAAQSKMPLATTAQAQTSN